MSEPTLPAPALSDRNLLFGILALQMDFITRDALVVAMQAWVFDKAKPLGQILVAQEALSGERHALLEALIQEHLKRHEGDPHKSLTAVGAARPAYQELQGIADADLHASLALVATPSDGGADPYATHGSSAPRTPSPSAPRFRVLRPHAKGGLGEVFVARDLELPREVALKQIQGRHADDPEARARFLREAEVTGGLEHPGVVPVYGLGCYDDGRPFYAMRFIRGENLQEAIRRFHQADTPGRDPGERSLALRELLGRFVAVCNAIAYAHSRGVLHRDLKPGNVMLGPYGETLVVDWGLARPVSHPAVAGEEPLLAVAPAGAVLTQVGSAVGTPPFMPPEQAAGRLDLLGPASDVYSLGATLYCLLTGQAPFQGDDVGAVLRRVQRGDFSPPRQLKRGVPPSLEAVCLKAMALKPEGRYASARALADDIEHWLADEPVSARREPWRDRARRWLGRHRTLVTATAVALLVGTVSLIIATALLAVANEGERAATSAALKSMQEAQEWRQKAGKYLRQYVQLRIARPQEGPPLSPEERGELRRLVDEYNKKAKAIIDSIGR